LALLFVPFTKILATRIPPAEKAIAARIKTISDDGPIEDVT
jgi:hypothetical protein